MSSAEVPLQQASLQKLPKTTPTPTLVDLVTREGGVVVEDMFSSDQVDRLNSDLDPILERIPFPEGPAHFVGTRTKRFTNPVTHSEVFRTEWLQDEKLLEWAGAMLAPVADSVWLNTAQVIEIYPGQAAQPLHRDCSLYPIFFNQGPKGPEVLVNCLVALTNFSEEVGATRVIAGSHLWSDFQDSGNSSMTIPVAMKKGSALLFSGKILHGGGANVSKNEVRRGLALAFNAGLLMPTDAHPFMIPQAIAKTLPQRVQNILGFRTFNIHSKLGGKLWFGENQQDLGKYLNL